MNIFKFKKAKAENNPHPQIIPSFIQKPKFMIGDMVWKVWFDENKKLTQATKESIQRIMFTDKGFVYSDCKNGDYFYEEERFLTNLELKITIGQL